MSDRKSITINSTSLLGGGGGGAEGGRKRGTRRSKGSGRLRPSSIVQPGTLKKTLLERIKQHQRIREQGRDNDEKVAANTVVEERKSAPSTETSSSFLQSLDFLRKLALKKRQNLTQRRSSSARSSLIDETTKTPEAKMLHQVADTLHNGEIITNTGLIGLPVVNTDISTIIPTPTLTPTPKMITPSSAPMATIPISVSSNLPNLSLGQEGNIAPSILPPPSAIPNITELADLYNSTVASTTLAVSPSSDDTTKTVTPLATGSSSSSVDSDNLPLHIPDDPTSFLPSIFIKEAPPHGCLKNGTKPTFREWADKMLHKPLETITNMFSSTDGTTDESRVAAGNTENATTSLKNKVREYPENMAGLRVKIRKTNKRKYRIGKHDDVVGVLLKNKEGQQHIQKQHLTLKQKSIGEIRKYLYDHHLLKIGSNAPPDVLRRMYEDSILTGDVKNTNKGVLLHNFLSGES